MRSKGIIKSHFEYKLANKLAKLTVLNEQLQINKAYLAICGAFYWLNI